MLMALQERWNRLGPIFKPQPSVISPWSFILVSRVVICAQVLTRGQSTPSFQSDMGVMTGPGREGRGAARHLCA